MSGRSLLASFLAAIFLVLGGCSTPSKSPASLSFALMGDIQYNQREEEIFPQLLDAVSAQDLAFVVHVGDFKAGSNSPCTDELYLRRLNEFNQSKHPLIFTPGDNDWVDCRRPTNNRGDPIERLAKIRELFHSRPNALGKTPLQLQRQSDTAMGNGEFARYRENAMWTRAGVVFITLNIQGSNDNLGFDAANNLEHAERTRANIAWLKLAIERTKAADAIGLAIFLQANPGFEESIDDVKKSGYAEFLGVFDEEAKRLGKPVLFAHGDTHHYRVDKPYISPLSKQPVANVMRVETFGSPFTDWVRITVDADNPAGLFTVKPGGFSSTVKHVD
ncbi:MAG: metallophosphoesterase [Betaproteobacteria bacterium]|nr:metallophosphoesterase [Betaproteobacteria bacterium]